MLFAVLHALHGANYKVLLLIMRMIKQLNKGQPNLVLRNSEAPTLGAETRTQTLYPIPSPSAGGDVFEIKFIEVSVGIYI